MKIKKSAIAIGFLALSVLFNEGNFDGLATDGEFLYFGDYNIEYEYVEDFRFSIRGNGHRRNGRRS